jgi:hypothetical protein
VDPTDLHGVDVIVEEALGEGRDRLASSLSIT